MSERMVEMIAEVRGTQTLAELEAVMNENAKAGIVDPLLDDEYQAALDRLSPKEELEEKVVEDVKEEVKETKMEEKKTVEVPVEFLERLMALVEKTTNARGGVRRVNNVYKLGSTDVNWARNTRGVPTPQIVKLVEVISTFGESEFTDADLERRLNEYGSYIAPGNSTPNRAVKVFEFYKRSLLAARNIVVVK